jgi:hypothetical protein
LFLAGCPEAHSQDQNVEEDYGDNACDVNHLDGLAANARHIHKLYYRQSAESRFQLPPQKLLVVQLLKELLTFIKSEVLLLSPFLKHINLAHTLSACFFMIYFNNFPSSTPRSSK